MVLPNISSPRKWRVIIAVNFPIEAIGRKKPDKNQGFNGIWTCDLRDTGAMLYQLSYEATHWERGQLYWVHISHEEWNDVKYIWNNSYIWTASFQLLKLENLLRWPFFTLIYNRSSNIWIISYILHIDTYLYIYPSRERHFVLNNNPRQWSGQCPELGPSDVELTDH